MIDQFQDRAAGTLAEAATALDAMLLTIGSDELAHAFREWGCPLPMGQFVIVHGLVTPQGLEAEARFLLVDDEGDLDQGWQYQASVVRHDGEWFVNWMRPRCTACFGQGVLEDAGFEICGVCGGNGWGVLGSRPYRYSMPRLAALPS